ncbi:MAG: TIGR04168 family protein [Elainellaceae cyanobacterium]
MTYPSLHNSPFPGSELTASAQVSPSLKIAVIGDVHDLWESEDRDALHHLGVDLALFVGDFGNEAVEVVEAIAQLDLPKAAIMGNHDAWYNATTWGRRKCPYDPQKENWVQRQLDALGEAHVGYGKLDLPKLGLSVVGGRPFSWGGPEWKHEKFYQDWYGVNNAQESIERIVGAVKSTAFFTVLFIGHTGPQGLGDRPEDLCGRDWRPIGGDYGDPDLAAAIAQARTLGKSVPLVTFGHMHHSLRHRKDREREKIAVQDGIVYLNAASVPRIVEKGGDRRRNFSIVQLEHGVVTQCSLIWLNQQFDIIAEEQLLVHPSQMAQATS